MWEWAIRSESTSSIRMKDPVNYLELIAGMVWWKKLVFAETVAKGFSVGLRVQFLCEV